MNQNKLVVTIAVSIFTLFSAGSYAAGGTMKLEELTKEQRMDMRHRAEQLTAERSASPNHRKTAVGQSPKAKKINTKAKTEIRS